jgi:hypothetical protein
MIGNSSPIGIHDRPMEQFPFPWGRRFTRRKCQRLDIDALGDSLPFTVWLAGADDAKA